MKKSFSHFFIIFICSILISVGLAHANPPENNDSIIIILNDWTSQIVMSKITGRIFQTMGYKVLYKEVEFNSQWGGLARGKYHVQVEIWEGTMKNVFERMVTNGSVLDAGKHEATSREDWWYPSYVEELCPGLPDWRALKECYPIFATPETSPKGRFLTGPWENNDKIRVVSLGMKFKVVKLNSGDELWTELEAAAKIKAPIVLFNWTPNWVEARYNGKFVEFPDYQPECETDPAWGINKKVKYDCGNPKDGWLKKGAWAGMEKKWPCAYETLKNISFSNTMIAQLALMVDVHKMDYDIAASKWLSENEEIWKSWIPDL